MKKNKRFISLAMTGILLLVAFSSVSVSAHDTSPIRYPRRVYRSMAMNHGVVLVDYYIDVKDSNYRTQLLNAINDWENKDAGYVSLRAVRKVNAYARFYDTWDSTKYNPKAYAVTISRSITYAVSEAGVNWSGPIGQISRKVMRGCNIYVNKKYQQQNKFNNHDIQKTWAHEIGHTLGWGEANDNTISIMRQGKGSKLGWTNYWMPQDHDRKDLISKFQWKTVNLPRELWW